MQVNMHVHFCRVIFAYVQIRVNTQAAPCASAQIYLHTCASMEMKIGNASCNVEKSHGALKLASEYGTSDGYVIYEGCE